MSRTRRDPGARLPAAARIPAPEVTDGRIPRLRDREPAVTTDTGGSANDALTVVATRRRAGGQEQP
ncbi:hypothetical protein [Gordonia humi]|uniref:Uncharacterized protein n=1 Tax=Gordonia humi TaxID=686429 RepID=A0A840F3I9_9ACTN|nr:hypothetical protein [Gordonia humi]MBB4137053.1 hypothetical protein [Gordonia humi]